MRLRKSATCSTKPKRQRKSSLLAHFVRPLGRLMRIEGPSMTPLLSPGELVVVQEGAFDCTAPRCGDLVAARPSRLGGKACVKRVVGLPHQMVRDGARTWHLGANEYFLLGDHQEDSLDSRALGPVTQEELLGRVWFRLWPPARLSS